MINAEQEGMGCGVIHRPGEYGELNASAIKHDIGILEPKLGMEFDSEDAAKSFYDEYARRVGFRTKVFPLGHLKPDGVISSCVLVCARDVSKRKSSNSCEAMFEVELKGDRWVVTRFVKDHSHIDVSSSKVRYLRPHRHSAHAAKKEGGNHQLMDAVPSGYMNASIEGALTSPEANCLVGSISPVKSNPLVKGSSSMNHMHVIPRGTLGKETQNMLDYFKKMQAENPGFFYAIQLDEQGQMANAFWSDVRSRTAYSHFGDAITLETSHRINQCKVPFALFMGLNNHGQTILFGCALLLDDSEPSFVWLLKTFLTAMSNKQPTSITTDQVGVIQTAVSKVVPGVRHRIGKWHVLRECQERLALFCFAHPDLQAELLNCINLSETMEEFELSWASFIEKYDLAGNDWLLSLYNSRHQWVPAYFRNSFFAAISPNQDSHFSFFDSYVNQQTCLPMFFRQYERAMESWFEKEIQADYETMSTMPELKTPSPMEKQAADVYTSRIFNKFQEELVETFVYTANRMDGDDATSIFRVAKFEDDRKAYMVTLNVSDITASCSCQMFEYSGILCRHILTVFTVTSVLTLPSHYILRRWSKNAKDRVPKEESSPDDGLGIGSTASRYNSLCQEVFRYAEEGAWTPETYRAALSALREGAKTVHMLKKNVVKILPDISHASAVGSDDKRTSPQGGDMNPQFWPRQDESTRQFSLNDNNLHSQLGANSKLPRLVPVSLQRDDVVSDSTVKIPCLKSLTWEMENKKSPPVNRVAVINLKLQDNSKNPPGESDVKFQLSLVVLEPMLRSMADINKQLLTAANRVSVIKLKLHDIEMTSGESEVKFQVSRDTLGAMMRSMAYIKEQLSNPVEIKTERPSKRSRK